MAYFLLKTEPEAFSINDLAREGVTSWGGVRNYQARNILRAMKVGDRCIIYHSSCAVPAAVGIAEVVREAYPDPLQFEQKSEYFDAGSRVADPRWSAVDVRFVRKFSEPFPRTHMQEIPAFAGMRLLARGNRLSVMELDAAHYDIMAVW